MGPWEFLIEFGAKNRWAIVHGKNPDSSAIAYSIILAIVGGDCQWHDVDFKDLSLTLYPQELRDHVKKLLKMKVFW